MDSREKPPWETPTWTRSRVFNIGKGAQDESVKEEIEDFAHGMKTVLRDFLTTFYPLLQLNLLKSCFVEKMSTVLVQYLGDALLVLGPEIAFSLNILNTRQADREKRRGGGETCFPLDHVGQIPF